MDDQCKLFMNSKNALNPKVDNHQRYIALVVEELLKNRMKRRELLSNQVDNTVDVSIFEDHDDEVILKHSSYADQRKRLAQLYKKGTDYYDRMTKLFDMINPANFRNVDKIVTLDTDLMKSECFRNFEALNPQWTTMLGDKFLRRRHKGTTNCFIEALSLALNQRDHDTHTISSIRKKLAGSIAQLRGDKKKKGWELLLAAYRNICKEQIPEDYSLEQLVEHIKSNHHQICFIDLIMLSQLYNVKFIVIPHTRAPKNVYGPICLGITTTVADSYIFLYESNIDQYQVIAKCDEDSDPQNKYVFSKKDADFPDVLYQTWLKVCANDTKTAAEEVVPTLFNYPLLKPIEVDVILPVKRDKPKQSIKIARKDESEQEQEEPKPKRRLVRINPVPEKHASKQEVEQGSEPEEPAPAKPKRILKRITPAPKEQTSEQEVEQGSEPEAPEQEVEPEPAKPKRSLKRITPAPKEQTSEQEVESGSEQDAPL
jgi:hypothetical protein